MKLKCSHLLKPLNKNFDSSTPQNHSKRTFQCKTSCNYAFKKCIPVERLKLWLLKLTKILFLMAILKIKLTLANISTKTKSEKISNGGTTVTKQLIFFSIVYNSTTLTPLGFPGVSREAKLSTEFEFGTVVH